MLTYSFDNLKNESLYAHLYSCIRRDILDGRLASGEKLPSKRSFAKNLGVSTITVENAYAQLMSEGYIYSLPKKGFYVSDLSDSFSSMGSAAPAHSDSFSSMCSKGILKDDTYRDASTDSNISIGDSCNEKALPLLADFSSNQTRPENFPFSVWAKLMRETLSTDSTELMTKPPCGGIMGLRRAIAAHLAQFRGMDVKPEQIFVGAGTEYLYGLLIQLLGFDKVYAIENPGYEKIAQIYASYGVRSHYVSMDEQGVRMDELEESGADVVHISPSHHFPTGIVTPVSRRYELLGWAAKADSHYIIEDDYDSEFRMVGRPIPSLQSMDITDKVIYINTFTKSLTSTMRISYMVLPEKLAKRFVENFSFYSCTVSNFEQYSLMRFIEEGYFEKHINRMRNFYHKQRDILLAAIKKSPLSSLVAITEEDAGLHFLMKIKTSLPDETVAARALRGGVKLTGLAMYYHDCPEPPAHVFVMNYSYLDTKHLDEAIRVIYEAVSGRIN